MLTQAPRGTKDILPEKVGTWRYVEEKIRAICARYGFSEIRTPMFEHTELFQRGIGDTTDVVEKEMYTFADRGGRSLTLRPENTASAVRAYLEHKLYADAPVRKLFYIGSMFRFDRPQKGRFREFHQFGVEVLGEQSPLVDAEIIILAVRFLESLGLTDLVLSLNSVGDATCRAQYRAKLQAFFRDKAADLCEDCRSRLLRNPMRLLDCKNEKCQALSKGAPEITDCLCDDCQAHFLKVQAYLRAAGIRYTLDPRLVRGLDYYTRTAFEIKYAPLGAQSAVAGGGRYDGLVEEIGGAPTPGIGFAVGLERVMVALDMQNLGAPEEQTTDAFLVALGEAAQQAAFPLLIALRDEGLRVGMDYAGRSLKSQMRTADKARARFVAILGDAELAENCAVLRNMGSSEQRRVPLPDLINTLCVEVKK
ncbi:MAG: histidine--tRNA ligase [Schwartzia sp. (in: firmicutes)]